jgi:hypothetical protein
MDHQKQIRDQLEKHNQLVKYILFRFFQDQIPSILYVLYVKSIIKTIIFTSHQNNIKKESHSATTTIISKTYAIDTSISGKEQKRELMNKQKEEQSKNNRDATR